MFRLIQTEVFQLPQNTNKFSGTLDFLSEGVLECVIDIIYETCIALIGGAVTAYVLGVLLNKQQENATKWREEIRRKINESEEL